MDVAPERLEGFLARFAERHGDLTWTAKPEALEVSAADGAVAECLVPFPPLRADPEATFGGLPEHAMADRTVGVLLVRRGGHAAGIFDGTRLTASKVGSRHVQGRSAAGGWSQQRFARRREGQARLARDAATDTAVQVLLSAVDRLEAVVVGGDRRAVDDVLADTRLAPLLPLVVQGRLDVPDPRQRVLEGTAAMFRAVRVRLQDPAPAG